MKNFNWEDFKNGKIAIQCDTEEKAKNFLEECSKRGIKIEEKRGRVAEGTNSWRWYRGNTVYFCGIVYSRLLYTCRIKLYEKGYKIIKWEIDEAKEITLNKEITLSTEDISELSDYLVENASYAFETQDRELLEKVLLDYVEKKWTEQ